METPNYWDDLLYSLQKGRCILVLGSGLSTGKNKNGTEQSLTEMLAQHLAEQIESKNRAPEGSRDNLFQIANEFVRYFKRMALERETEDFYKREEYSHPNQIQKDLAALPFHVILSTAPDDLFYKALIANNKNPNCLYYQPPGANRSAIHLDWEDPDAGKPLVYNMLGIWKESESLILTESEQLDYLQDVISNNEAIPNSLLKLCNAENSVFVFLGFNFENWQLRLLLRALKMGGEEISHWAFQNKKQLNWSQDTKVFFKDLYGVQIVDMEAEEFVRELSRRYREQVPATEESASVKLKAVCLYSQEDVNFREELDAHLAPLREHQQIEIWSDAMIKPGEVVDDAVQKAIDNAQIIIVLASASFIDSEKLYHEHLARAIQRFQEKKAKIFPVIVRDFAWAETEIGQLPIVLPQDNGTLKPVADWPQRDQAYTEIVQLIQRHIKYLMEDLKTTN